MNGNMNFWDLQEEVGKWSRNNFGDQPSTNPLLGIVEEVGELSHAHLKGIQSIRHTAEEIQVMKVDAVGDILIYLADYCSRDGIHMQKAVEATWKKVSKRDWVEQPLTAAESDTTM